MSRKNNNNRKNGKPNNSKPEESSSTNRNSNGAEAPKTSDKEETTSEPNKGKTFNDPAWYSVFPELAQAAGNLPFSEPLGSRQGFAVPTQSAGPWTVAGNMYSAFTCNSISGIMNLRVKSSYGSNQLPTDPLNVAATALYTHVRYVNSGRKNYDQADLMLMTAAIADIFSFVMFMQKIYSAAFTYSARNHYLGRAVLSSLGIDADDVISNLANFRYRLNAFISKVTTYAVPSTLPIFMRKAFMYSGLYIENSEDIKDQMYQFVPEGFMRFAIDSKGKGMLEFLPLGGRIEDPTAVGSDMLTVDQLFTYADSLLKNVWGDEDFGLMSGDIIKAYGSNIITVSPIPSEMYLTPTYDEHVLMQIHNASIMPVYRDAYLEELASADLTDHDVDAGYYPLPDSDLEQICQAGSVYQDSHGNLVSKELTEANVSPGATASAGSLQYWASQGFNSMLDIKKNVPTVDDVLESTRLTAVGATNGNIYNDRGEITCGTEIVMDVYVSSFVWTGTAYGLAFTQFKSNINPFNDNWTILPSYMQFEYAPLVHRWTLNDYTIQNFQTLAQLRNFTYVRAEQIQRLHEVAMLSLLFVPGVAKQIS